MNHSTMERSRKIRLRRSALPSFCLLPETSSSFSSMPYSKIQFFSIQTPGFAEIVPDSELFLMFSNGFTARFEFKGGVDIGEIGRMISEYVLD